MYKYVTTYTLKSFTASFSGGSVSKSGTEIQVVARIFFLFVKSSETPNFSTATISGERYDPDRAAMFLSSCVA